MFTMSDGQNCLVYLVKSRMTELLMAILLPNYTKLIYHFMVNDYHSFGNFYLTEYNTILQCQ